MNTNTFDEGPGIDVATVGGFSFPITFLKSVAMSCQYAQESNSNSWAIALDPPWIVMLIGRFATMVIGHQEGSFIALGTLDDVDRDSLDPNQIYTDYSFEGFYLKSLDVDTFDRLYAKYREQHRACVDLIAKKVQTRTNFHHRHQQQLAEQVGETTGELMPTPGYASSEMTPHSDFWRYTVNETCWEVDVAQGFLSSQDWPNPQVNLNSFSSDFDAFQREVQSALNTGPVATRRLWNLSNGMRAGDRVIAHDRTTIVRLGTVVGDYEFHPQEPTRVHRRRVRWEAPDMSPSHFPKSDTAARTRSWDITPLSAREYMDLLGEPSKATAGELSETAPVYIGFLSDKFANAGLTYADHQIATFYTALQTKGFVVLSGISGTGKSKIAQGFVDLLPIENATPVTIQPGFASNGGLTVPKDLAFRLGFPKMDASGPLSISISTLQSDGLIRVRNNYGANLFTEIRPKGTVRDKIASFSPGTTLYAHFSEWQEGLPTKVILEDKAPRNSLFLSVRPDWRDSTSLLGYYNPLTETYEWTEFLRFILRAAESYRKGDGLAWFVILDEMNLAHVEYYFADLLSIIESGRDDDGWSREPIRLTYPDGKTDNPPPHEIKLPPNLYIIGTVNMDETTHAFSPKVLDRAFTIELTEVDFSDYPPSPASTGTEMSDDERQALLRAFTRQGAFARIDKDEIRAIVDEHDEIREWLQRLNVELAAHQFQFGYRVFDEIAQFVHNAEENRMFEDESASVPAWVRAFDHAVYMKVLPKFNGSHARLHGPLTALLAWAKNPAGEPETTDPVVEDDMEAPVSASPAVRLNRVATRAERMLTLLNDNGFVSFG